MMETNNLDYNMYEENKRSRTVLVSKCKKHKNFGFTMQTYGIKRPVIKKLNEDEFIIHMITYIDYVEYESPAYFSGLHRGDVILAINGMSMEEVLHEDLVKYISSQNVLRMVVLFEDCSQKIELYLRYFKLKDILKLKLSEFQLLEERENSLNVKSGNNVDTNNNMDDENHKTYDFDFESVSSNLLNGYDQLTDINYCIESFDIPPPPTISTDQVINSPLNSNGPVSPMLNPPHRNGLFKARVKPHRRRQNSSSSITFLNNLINNPFKSTTICQGIPKENKFSVETLLREVRSSIDIRLTPALGSSAISSPSDSCLPNLNAINGFSDHQTCSDTIEISNAESKQIVHNDERILDEQFCEHHMNQISSSVSDVSTHILPVFTTIPMTGNYESPKHCYSERDQSLIEPLGVVNYKTPCPNSLMSLEAPGTKKTNWAPWCPLINEGKLCLNNRTKLRDTSSSRVNIPKNYDINNKSDEQFNPVSNFYSNDRLASFPPLEVSLDRIIPTEKRISKLNAPRKSAPDIIIANDDESPSQINNSPHFKIAISPISPSTPEMTLIKSRNCRSFSAFAANLLRPKSPSFSLNPSVEDKASLRDHIHNNDQCKNGNSNKSVRSQSIFSTPPFMFGPKKDVSTASLLATHCTPNKKKSSSPVKILRFAKHNLSSEVLSADLALQGKYSLGENIPVNSHLSTSSRNPEIPNHIDHNISQASSHSPLYKETVIPPHIVATSSSSSSSSSFVNEVLGGVFGYSKSFKATDETIDQSSLSGVSTVSKPSLDLDSKNLPIDHSPLANDVDHRKILLNIVNGCHNFIKSDSSHLRGTCNKVEPNCLLARHLSYEKLHTGSYDINNCSSVTMRWPSAESLNYDVNITNVIKTDVLDPIIKPLNGKCQNLAFMQSQSANILFTPSHLLTISPSNYDMFEFTRL